MERPERTKRVIVPKKRKKIHAPGNKDVQLEIQVGNDDLTNKIIVSLIYLIFNFLFI